MYLGIWRSLTFWKKKKKGEKTRNLMLIKLLLMLKELIRYREPFLCALVCFQLLNWSWALWPQQVTVISGSHLGLFASVNVVAFQLQMVKYFIFRGGSPFQQLNGLMLHLFTYIFFHLSVSVTISTWIFLSVQLLLVLSGQLPPMFALQTAPLFISFPALAHPTKT